MFVPKRWLVPGALSILLLTMVMALALSGFRPGGDAEAIGVAARSPYLDTDLARSMADPALCTPGVAEPVALTAQEEADIRAYLEAVEANKSIVITDAGTNSGVITDNQFTDGGFGDIGLQWREVEVGAPVTNIHISGTGNTTTIVVGDDNVVTVVPDESVTVAPTPPPVETPDPSLVSTPPVEVVAPVVGTPTVPATTPTSDAGRPS